MEQSELLKLLQMPFQSGIAQVVALSSTVEDAHTRWLHWMDAMDLPTVILRPPHSWEPLAPLRHLCAHWGVSLPEISVEESMLSALWLGRAVLSSRFFLRVSEVLQPFPTIAWIEGEDLDVPWWGDFLRMACLGYLKLPITFLFLASPKQRAQAGMKRLSIEPLLSQAHASSLEGEPIRAKRRERWGKPLPKQTARYLGKALLLGDCFEIGWMEQVSRASHIRHRAILRREGLLEEDGCFVLERLRSARLVEPVEGPRWRRDVWRALQKKGGAVFAGKALWIRTLREHEQKKESGQELEKKARVLSLGSCIEHGEVVRAWMGLGATPWAAEMAIQAEDAVSATGRFAAYLIAQQEPEGSLPSLEAMSLPSPYRELALVRAVGGRKDEGVAAMNTILQELSIQGPLWAAALVAVDLARWHLGQGRLRPAFQLLGPFKDVKDWGVQWAMGLIFTEVYCRLERYDLSRHALEEATASVPRPMSPVLVGELRMATARLFGSSGDLDEAEVQLAEARDAFRAAGDVVRLGRYLLAVGEIVWRRGQFEEARGIFGKAIDLFRRSRDGIGLWEAQLKLGLVLNQAPATILDARS